MGPKTDADALAKAQKDLEDLKKEIEQNRALLAQQKQLEEDQNKERKRLAEIHNEAWKRFEDQARVIQGLKEEQKLEAQKRLDKDRRKWEQLKREAEQEHQLLMAKIKADAEALQQTLKQRENQVTAMSTQPPPVFYWYQGQYYFGGWAK